MTAGPHLLLDGVVGWGDASLDHVAAGPQGLELQRLPVADRPLVDAEGSFGGLVRPTGVAVDADDRIYVLDLEDLRIRRFDPCTSAYETLPCLGGEGAEPRRFSDPHGIAISCRGDMYVADSGNRRVQVFALKDLPLRALWAGPNGDWEPWDVEVSADGHAVYVSDRQGGRIHSFDTSGRLRWSSQGKGTGLPALKRPTHLALDGEGRLYVIQEGTDTVRIMGPDGAGLGEVRLRSEVLEAFPPLAIGVDAHGNVWVGNSARGGIDVYSPAGEGYEYAGRCRRFSGTAAGLTFDSAATALVADPAAGQVLRVAQAGAYPGAGTFISAPLDSREARCHWHRVVLSGAVAPGTRIRVETFTSEAEKDPAEIAELPDSRWRSSAAHGEPGQGAWDCLVLSPPGRYLWIRLTLEGTGAASPSVESIELRYPRDTSLRFLPSVYAEDDQSREFLERFLSIFDTVRGSAAERIDDFARYLDPDAAPSGEGSDFLQWLASWLGLSLDRSLPLERRREIVRRSPGLFKLRGTPEGLRRQIELYAGVEPRILEHFKLRRWLFLERARLGDDSMVWGSGIVRRLQLGGRSSIDSFELAAGGDPVRDPFHAQAHRFTVFVPLGGEDGTRRRRAIERIVELAKPAHADADVAFIEPGMRIGTHSFVGVDSAVGRYPQGVRAGEARLDGSAVLGFSRDEERPPRGRLGVRSRVGSTAVID
jgi:phage tail-like protein